MRLHLCGNDRYTEISNHYSCYYPYYRKRAQYRSDLVIDKRSKTKQVLLEYILSRARIVGFTTHCIEIELDDVGYKVYQFLTKTKGGKRISKLRELSKFIGNEEMLLTMIRSCELAENLLS
jgi:hypothetical protein